MQSESFALGIGAGLLLCLLVELVAPRNYADALAEGRSGEAGFWAFLSSSVAGRLI